MAADQKIQLPHRSEWNAPNAPITPSRRQRIKHPLTAAASQTPPSPPHGGSESNTPITLLMAAASQKKPHSGSVQNTPITPSRRQRVKHPPSPPHSGSESNTPITASQRQRVKHPYHPLTAAASHTPITPSQRQRVKRPHHPLTAAASQTPPHGSSAQNTPIMALPHCTPHCSEWNTPHHSVTPLHATPQWVKHPHHSITPLHATLQWVKHPLITALPHCMLHRSEWNTPHHSVTPLQWVKHPHHGITPLHATLQWVKHPPSQRYPTACYTAVSETPLITASPHCSEWNTAITPSWQQWVKHPLTEAVRKTPPSRHYPTARHTAVSETPLITALPHCMLHRSEWNTPSRKQCAKHPHHGITPLHATLQWVKHPSQQQRVKNVFCCQNVPIFFLTSMCFTTCSLYRSKKNKRY